MSETTHERVDELLETAESSLESLPDSAEDDGLAESLEGGGAADLREAAREASDLLEDDSEAVLEAIGLRELPGGTEAGSIPEAIAKGDEGRVSELHALVKLAQLSDRWDEPEGEEGEDDGEVAGALEDGVAELRETLAERDGVSDGDVGGSEELESETEGDDESETNLEEEREDRKDDEPAEDTDDAASDTDADEAEDGSIEDQLRSAMDDALGGFGDEVREVRDQFQQLRNEGDEEADRKGVETDTADEGTTDEETADEETTDAADEGAADDGDTGGSRGRTAPRGSTMHSTMAPPPSKRLDMGRAGRLSTMPDRNARSRR